MCSRVAHLAQGGHGLEPGGQLLGDPRRGVVDPYPAHAGLVHGLYRITDRPLRVLGQPGAHAHRPVLSQADLGDLLQEGVDGQHERTRAATPRSHMAQRTEWHRRQSSTLLWVALLREAPISSSAIMSRDDGILRSEIDP